MKLSIAVICLALAACVTPPDRVSIQPASQGLILVEVDPATTTFNTPEGTPGSLALAYFLTFSRYPADASASTPAVLGDWVHIDIPKDGGTEHFYAAPAPAGTYALEALNVGGGVSWGTCFNQATVAFEVPAGEIVYLGEFSPRPMFEDIAANLPNALQIGSYRYLFDRKSPTFGAPDSAQQKSAEITEFLRRVYPRVQGPVRMANLRPVSFQSGKPSVLSRFPRCAKTG
jgi:hypothetical protein